MDDQNSIIAVLSLIAAIAGVVLIIVSMILSSIWRKQDSDKHDREREDDKRERESDKAIKVEFFRSDVVPKNDLSANFAKRNKSYSIDAVRNHPIIELTGGTVTHVIKEVFIVVDGTRYYLWTIPKVEINSLMELQPLQVKYLQIHGLGSVPTAGIFYIEVATTKEEVFLSPTYNMSEFEKTKLRSKT